MEGDLLNQINLQAQAEENDSISDRESVQESLASGSVVRRPRRGRPKKKLRNEDDETTAEDNDERNKRKRKNKKHQYSMVMDEEALQFEDFFYRYLLDQCKDTIETMLLNGRTTLWVDFNALNTFDMDLATAISEHYYRFRPYLENALKRACREIEVEEDVDIDSQFQISFHQVPLSDRVRDLRTDRIGKLISFSGTVTRTSETRPELLVGIFVCGQCSAISSEIEQEFKYSEPGPCDSLECREKSRSGFTWKLDPSKSRFCDWQKIRVQENTQEVPAGSMPRSIEVIARFEGVEQAKPGDKCVFTGTLFVVPDVSRLRAPGDPPGNNNGSAKQSRDNVDAAGLSGLHSLGVRDLTYSLHFLSCSIQQCDGFGMTPQMLGDDTSYNFSRKELRERLQDTFTEEEIQEIKSISQQPNLIEKMKRSFAPAIYGHADVKLGVLLLLLGGVHKKTKDRINLRGDINVCIVGDPSTAKSQFLRYACMFSPRAVYTSGKSSTAAGLTASVVRDPDTGEWCIEAGALMLADNGVCCIDEFEKMDDVDQVAIHEAMEQQTLSITKAGIQATLNARTSVLAAANPIYGRYDRSKTLKSNLTIGAAIMSRFDLFFVVLDEVDEVNDRSVASHILKVHSRRIAGLQDDDGDDASRAATQPLFTCEQLQRYVRYARTIDPICGLSVQPKLVECYIKLRMGDSGVGVNRQAYRITVRQLEALIRLSEAIARLHLDTEIKEFHVEKAFHLLKTSIVQVESDSLNLFRGPSSGSGTKTGDVNEAEFQRLGEEILHYIQREEDRLGEPLPQTLVVDFILETCIFDIHNLQESRNKVNGIIKRLLELEILVEATPPREGLSPFDEDMPMEERRLLNSKIPKEFSTSAGGASNREDRIIEVESVRYVEECTLAAEHDDNFVGVSQTAVVNYLLENFLLSGRENEFDIERKRHHVNRRLLLLVVNKNLLIRKTAQDSAAEHYSFDPSTPEEEQYLLTTPTFQKHYNM